ncbi:MAG: glycosyltransferase [Methylacidiphilales bacterium]|nr:glycosyltransferase [Candidatus Methylacidiphilales bacterium]
MKPHIAFVHDISGARASGCQLLWANAACHLSETQAAHVGVCCAPGAAMDMFEFRRLQDLGVPIHVPKSPKGGLARRLLRFTGIWHENTAEEQTFAWLDRFQPDLVVICQSAFIGVDYWGEPCLRRKWPYVSISQCAAEHIWPPDDQIRQLREGFQHAKRNYFVSQRNREWVETVLAESLANARVICNPFRVNYDAPFAWPAEEGIWRVGCVARLYPPAKGQDLILHMLALEKWKARPLSVTFAGSGSHAKSLKKLAARLGISQVTFAGQIEDIDQFWARHHMLLSGSRYEGMPMVVLEALLCGRPCVLTDVAGHAEHILEGKNGFLAAAPTVALLDSAMEKAWQERHRWRGMGSLAYQRSRSMIPKNPGSVLAEDLLNVATF